MTRSLVYLGLFLLFPFLAGAQSLQDKVDNFVRDYALRHANMSICVIDIEAHRIVAEHRAEYVVPPASTLKALTTATALSILGPNFRFPTELQYDGTIARGRLNGNVYLKGYGDPTLGAGEIDGNPDLDGIMDTFAAAIANKGITTITGSIIGDGSFYDSQGAVDSWSWADLGNYYGVSARGLNINDNQYTLYFARTARVGATPRIARIDPEIPWLEFVNEVKQAGPRTGDQAYIYGGPYTYLRYVRGTIPAGSSTFDIKGSIPDPPLLAARELRLALEREGITVARGETTVQSGMNSAQRRTITRHRSPVLADIIERTNMRSVNMYCEAMVKEIGRRKTGKGRTESGIEAMLAYWADRGVSVEGITLADGSGLSRANAVSARFLAEALRKVALDKIVFPVFRASLPRAGYSGNLKGKFRNTEAYGKLYAKSGTLGKVRAYTGYFTGANDRDYSFAILVSDYTSSGGAMRRRMDGLLQAFCE